MRLADFLMVILGSLIFAFFLHKLFPNKYIEATIISPVAESVRGISKIMGSFTSGGLESVVENSLKGTQGKYGIVIQNLKTGERYTQNENVKFASASLYKLWVMGALYKKVEAEEFTLDQQFSSDIKELNRIFNIDEENAELKEGTISLKVSQAAEKMIAISDNYAALLLASKVRNSNISAFMRETGLTQSSLGEPPQTTPYDIGLFYEKLYMGAIISKPRSDEMLSLLKQQRLNDRIPKYLPEGTIVAHKTGELGGFKHDAGIIYGRDPILFVVMSESNAPLGAAERIALLSRDVFNYFEKK